MGDSTDCISPVFKGCGKKTAEKLIKEPNKLQEIYKTKQYILNKTLIDFQYIPENIVQDIEEQLDNIIWKF